MRISLALASTELSTNSHKAEFGVKDNPVLNILVSPSEEIISSI
jgi:hypothetical protein